SITINLKSPQGRDVAYRLIAISDIVVENFSAGVLERLGFNYEALKNIRPDIIMVSMQGLGSTGPRKNYVTWGPSLMPYSGLSYLWNEPEAETPIGSQTAYPDYVVSLHMAYAVMAALHYRRRTGKGQYIDIAQAEVTASLIGVPMLDYLVNQRVAAPLGNGNLTRSPHGCYRCKGEDQWCVISVGNGNEWTVFCATIGSPNLASDPKFDTLLKRLENRNELGRIIEQWTARLTSNEVMEKLQGAGISAGIVHDGLSLSEDKHLKDRAFIG